MHLFSFLFIAHILFFTSLLQAQTVIITVNGLESNIAYLSSLQGEKTIKIDSVTSDNKRNFALSNIMQNQNTGFYRLAFSNNRWLDFLYDGREVEIELDINNITESINVIQSESNLLYYTFVKLNRSYKTKSELLQLMLARYPKEDELYEKVRQRFLSLQKEYLEFVNVSSQSEPNKFIARYIRNSQLPIVDIDLPIEKQLEYLKAHALDKVDFNDVSLVYTDAFTNKTIEYLTYYRNPQLPVGLLEKEFMTAIDSIINRVKVNQLVYQHVVEYLIDGFRRFGFDNVLNYIVENYVIKDDICLDEQIESSIQKRLDQNRKLPIGTVAPNVILPGIDGKEINIANLKSKKILIVFYTTKCPHCKDLLPELSAFHLEKKKSFEIVAISIDANKDEWLGFLKSNKFEWIDLIDTQSWGGKTASDFYLYATPTMFLLENNKIISKPITMNELKKAFN